MRAKPRDIDRRPARVESGFRDRSLGAATIRLTDHPTRTMIHAVSRAWRAPKAVEFP